MQWYFLAKTPFSPSSSCRLSQWSEASTNRSFNQSINLSLCLNSNHKDLCSFIKRIQTSNNCSPGKYNLKRLGKIRWKGRKRSEKRDLGGGEISYSFWFITCTFKRPSLWLFRFTNLTLFAWNLLSSILIYNMFWGGIPVRVLKSSSQVWKFSVGYSSPQVYFYNNTEHQILNTLTPKTEPLLLSGVLKRVPLQVMHKEFR